MAKALGISGIVGLTPDVTKGVLALECRQFFRDQRGEARSLTLQGGVAAHEER
jgi:hypothetical protein